jgi:hypothetical protein
MQVYSSGQTICAPQSGIYFNKKYRAKIIAKIINTIALLTKKL